MTFLSRAAWLAVVLAAAAPGLAAANPAITAAEVREEVRLLASEEYAGRGSGTAGCEKAGAYLAEQFRKAGLRPAGENGTFFQQFRVTVGVLLGRDNSLVLTLPGDEPADLQVRKDFLPVAFSGNGKVSGEVVFAGYGISQPELKHDDYQGLDVRGKVVVVLRRSPPTDGPNQLANYEPLRYKLATARDNGAAGVLFVTGPLTSEQEELGKLDLDGAAASARIPAAIVRREFVEELLTTVGKGLRGLQTAISHGGRGSLVIPGARAVLTVDVKRDERPTSNVLALLEGSDPGLKREVIVIGAHYDHLGMGGNGSLHPGSEPAIHYGADDNASGTAGLIELAEYFTHRRAQLKRSLLFIGFSGEEIGLLGSEHYVRNPTVPLERIVAMINLDMIGRSTNDTVQVIGTGTSPEWKAVLAAARERVRLTTKETSSAFDASDHRSFYMRDIPVLFFFTGVHPDYHRPSDTWEKINSEGQAKILQFVAAAAEQTAALPQRPRFAKVEREAPRASARFSVYVGTIPDYSDSSTGMTLTGVTEGSPAEKAGLRAGDVIVEFGGKKIANVYDFTFALQDAKAGTPLPVVVLRGGKQVKLTVTPAARN